MTNPKLSDPTRRPRQEWISWRGSCTTSGFGGPNLTTASTRDHGYSVGQSPSAPGGDACG